VAGLVTGAVVLLAPANASSLSQCVMVGMASLLVGPWSEGMESDGES
jgi:hypothetical protein